MIKLFRKLRRQLINQGRLRKYLLYAVGEILLVMVGILLALQVDNWSSTNADKLTRNRYMVQLQTEAENDLVRLEEHITNAQNYIQKAKINKILPCRFHISF